MTRIDRLEVQLEILRDVNAEASRRLLRVKSVDEIGRAYSAALDVVIKRIGRELTELGVSGF